MIDLPVQTVLPQVAEALKTRGAAVLSAAPGAGKTTLVPPYLLKELCPPGKKIVMLEPRRLAARASARRIASLMGEQVGGTVGYRTRFDTRVSPATRIEVLTEGILTRLIQEDPELSGIGTVIFDEFHERSIHADLALALCLDLRSALRNDLKLLVMSATIDMEKVSALLGSVPVIESPGKMYPVRTVYRKRPDPSAPLERDAVSAIREAVQNDPGDLLVFLPGEGEIRRTAALLEGTPLPGTVVRPLYGNLPQAEQDAALDPDPQERRKIILSTSIAETSLTIENIRIVIDCGRMRVPKFSPRNGMNRLETVRVSKASADQRRGRAGRTAPGVCYRLWTPEEELRLPAFNTPEILESDLVPLVLELGSWGLRTDQYDSLKWMDLPPASRVSQAAELLRSIGAFDAQNTITPHGKALLGLPMHPRLAHAVLKSKELGFGYTACGIAALLGERDLLRTPESDLRLRLAALEGKYACDAGAVRRIRAAAAQCAAAAGIRDRKMDQEAAGVIVSFAYPDRIGHSRSPRSGEYALANGTGARLRKEDPISGCEFLAAASVEGEGDRQIIFTAAPLSLEEIEQFSPELVSEEFHVHWNPERKAVEAEKQTRVGLMTVSARNALNTLPRERLLPAYLAGIREEGIAALPFEKASESLRERVAFLRRYVPDDFPDLSDEGLLNSLEQWLGPFVEGFSQFSQLKKISLHTALETLLTHQQRTELARLAPERIEVPSGSHIRVDYSSPDGVPFLSVKLQELFGMLETPRVAGGRVPVTIRILSPAMRPVQTTSDLKHFWAESYFLVRKDLRGRYPKHDWPENPLEARPHRGVRRG